MAKRKTPRVTEYVQSARSFAAMITKAMSEVPGGNATDVLELVKQRSLAKYRADLDAGTHELELKPVVGAEKVEKLYEKAKELYDRKKRGDEARRKGRQESALGRGEAWADEAKVFQKAREIDPNGQLTTHRLRTALKNKDIKIGEAKAKLLRMQLQKT